MTAPHSDIELSYVDCASTTFDAVVFDDRNGSA